MRTTDLNKHKIYKHHKDNHQQIIGKTIKKIEGSECGSFYRFFLDKGFIEISSTVDLKAKDSPVDRKSVV